MKPLRICFLVMAVSYGNVLAQTNSVAPRSWFSVPGCQLCPVSDKPASPEEMFAESVTSANVPNAPLQVDNFTQTEAISNSFAALDYRDNCLQDHVVLDSYLGEFDYRTYRLLHESNFLRRPEPPPDDLFSRTMNGIFTPTPLRIGKTTVCCSLVTAIKRRNPLCLLNPMVLNISW